MNKSKLGSVQKVVAISSGIIVLIAFGFQNCAKSIDLSQYSNSSSVAASSTPTPSPSVVNSPSPTPSPSSTTVAAASCATTIFTWTVNGITCSSTAVSPSLASGQGLAVTADKGQIGNATFTCTNGTLALASGAVCTQVCNVTNPYTWTVGPNSCTGSVPSTVTTPLVDGQAATITETSPNIGSVTITCTAGVIVPSALTCAPPNLDCTFAGTTVPNGSFVTAYLAAVATKCSSETRTCTNGVLSGSYTHPDCTPTGGCFTAGTPVDTPQGPVAIEKIKVGDKVYSFDFATNTTVVGEVVEVFVHHNYLYGTLTLSDGTTLQVTPEHRFFVPKLNDWVAIGQLKAGDILQKGQFDKAGLVTITSFDTSDKSLRADVYNFHVKKYVNYYVKGVLVHNAKL